MSVGTGRSLKTSFPHLSPVKIEHIEIILKNHPLKIEHIEIKSKFKITILKLSCNPVTLAALFSFVQS